MGHRTDLHEQIETALGADLATYVTERRAAGESWRRIALGITRQTDIELTDETLRVWFVVRGSREPVEMAS